MPYIKKTFISLLILITLNLCIPCTSFSGEITLSARDNITTHRPESVSTPEKDIQGETTVTPEKGSKKWLWAVAIIAVIAGGVALAGSSGGNSAGNNGSGVTLNW